MAAWQFWVAAAVMVLAVIAVLVQSLRHGPVTNRPNADMRVYRDQLREVDRDLARGVISDGDAERVRTEVSRRLLEADRAAQTAPVPDRRGGTYPAVLLIVGVLAGSGWLYNRLGAPGYPDVALADRIAMADEVYRTRPGQDQAEAVSPAAPSAPAPELLAQVETLRAAALTSPDDPTTLSALALAESGVGDMIAARMAQARLIDIKSDAATANDHAALAWMMIAAAGGYVSPEAEAVLINALEKDPANGLARYYSGLMFAQVGRPDRAFVIWKALLDDGPEDAPWIGSIRTSIGEIATNAGIRYEPPVNDGPSAEQVAASQEMTPEDRQAMITSMVEGLAERLASQGGPPEDWARLIASLATLGDKERAKAIHTEALAAFSGDPGSLDLLNDAARQVGISE